MAITYPLALPNTTSFSQVNFRARSNVSITQSPFTFKQQVLKFQGTSWEADIKLKPMKRDEAEEWISFFLKLDGQYGTFLLGDPNGLTPRGSAATTAGTPLVNGANQTGNSLAIDGCPASVNGYLKAGDYIQSGLSGTARLYKVLNDVNTNSSGEATLDIYPSIHTALSDNAELVVSSCRGRFRLASNEMDWDIQTNLMYGLSFSAVEAI